jgi:hypothetical protein
MKRRHWLSLAWAAALASMLASCRAPGPVDVAKEPFPEAQKEVERALLELLTAAEKKELERLESMHLYGPKFSKWEGKVPGRLDAEATRRAERTWLEAITAFRPAVEDLKVDVFGPAAVATFVMAYEVVDGGLTSPGKARATLVWVKTDSGWKVAHEHFSPIPEKP